MSIYNFCGGTSNTSDKQNMPSLNFLSFLLQIITLTYSTNTQNNKNGLTATNRENFVDTLFQVSRQAYIHAIVNTCVAGKIGSTIIGKATNSQTLSNKLNNELFEFVVLNAKIVGGAIPKTLQRVSMKKDICPIEYSEYLQHHLFDNNKPFPWEKIKDILNNELRLLRKDGLENIFDGISFDKRLHFSILSQMDGNNRILGTGSE